MSTMDNRTHYQQQAHGPCSMLPAIVFEPGKLEEWHQLPGGPEAECPCCGEVWQYMGTAKRGGQWERQFRHRHHPATGARVYRGFPVDADKVRA